MLKSDKRSEILMAGQRTKPLSGYKVIELSTFVAAPSCGRLLRDWGADVIKIGRAHV